VILKTFDKFVKCTRMANARWKDDTYFQRLLRITFDKNMNY